MRRRLMFLVALALGFAGGVMLLPGSRFVQVAFWQRLASPGALSTAHAPYENDCSNCHTRLVGADPAKCIACHANATALLQRQSTAFHSTIEACSECHVEHLGRAVSPTNMDHGTLLRIGLRRMPADEITDETRSSLARIVGGLWKLSADGSFRASDETLLDCASCHASRDRHWGLFGTDCSDCHATSSWRIAEFRHPSPRSVDCAQCHQAPPSHFMEHFEMVSMKVAGREHAEVGECFLCHQTTSWNDIRGVGVYKHH